MLNSKHTETRKPLPLSSKLEPPLKQTCIAMTVLERHNPVSHCLVYRHVKLIRRCPAHLVPSCISFSPHMIDSHLKDHLNQYRVKSVKYVSLNHIKYVCPVRICPRSKKPSNQSLPNHKIVRTSEKGNFLSHPALHTTHIYELYINLVSKSIDNN